MNNINNNSVSTITVRLRMDSNNIIGTGVLYYEDLLADKVYVLTAAHCMFEDSDNFERKFNSIYIDIYSPQEKIYKSITVENIDENLISKTEFEDIAIIILDKEKIDSINPSIPKIQVITERKSFNSFITKGFPKATKGKELAAVSVTWLQEMIETKCFQLQLNADYTATNAEGFSGAGIFLEANNEIYLFGIFIRFREEEKGKVIYCQYIDTANNVLRKNFLPVIKYSYLGENGLNPSFFADQIEQEIKNLGPRFNEKLNYQLPIARFFNNISNDSTYHQNIISKTDKWLTAKEYKKLKDNEYLAEIEIELETLRQETKDWLVEFQSHLVETEITLLPLTEKIKIFNDKILEKWHEIYDLSIEIKDEKDKPQKSLRSELSRLKEIQNANRELIKDVDSLNINLANHPALIIQGEAGCGKSHLLGDIATQRKNQNLPTILLLGNTFFNETIEKNILSILDLTCSFKDFIENLNSIGQQINSRVLILIDAINEGAGMDLWKSQIAGFIDKVAKYPAIGLVLTIRSTYYNDIIPENFKSNSNITIITHEGFKGNEYEAVKLFCSYYNLELPNFPILNPEFTNPLFLYTICEAVKDLPDKSFPKGFNGINKTYSLFKDSLNKKFENKRAEYKYQNIVSKAIEKLSDAIFKKEYQSLDLLEAVQLFNTEFSKFPYLLSDLIEESVLIKTRNEYDEENPKDNVSFSYQRFGDFFMAEALLKSYSTKEDLQKAFVDDTRFQKIANKYQWSYRGIIEAFSILLPERYNLELFELIDFFFNKKVNERDKILSKNITYTFFTQILLDSLKWRELSNIDYKKITNWLRKNGRLTNEEFYYKLTELSAIPNHPFNGDRLHRLLLKYSMPKRDSFWQNYITKYSSYDNNNNKIVPPLQRLIDWAWSPNISSNVDSETARLVAQTLAWVLSSTDITLRDKTTKALVNLLEQQPDVLIKVLMAFVDIDDLYILDRLYAVVYGCILRTEKDDSVKKIAQYTFDTIFKNGNLPVHILIRDYARNTIEYAIYKNVKLNIDVKLIRPPYRSRCNYKPLSNEELDKKYKPKKDNGHYRKNEWGITAILDSMVTEYGRGTGGYGDFGRYVFQSAVSNFKLSNRLNVDLLSNLAVEWIFEKYGYNHQIHGEYDSMASDSYQERQHKIERIGKKYQWIALYQILAIIADNYKIFNNWSFDEKCHSYKGPWELNIRNIDPAYITKNKDEDEGNYTKQNIKEWWEYSEYIHWNHPDAEWVKTTDDLIDPKQIIEKKDPNSEEWLQLRHFIRWEEPKKIGIERYGVRKKQLWYLIQGLLVKKTDKKKIISYLKRKNFRGRWLPENRNDNSGLINREKFWSPAYLDIYKRNKNIWDNIGKTKYKVIITTEEAKGDIEDDKSDANRTYNIPCKYIFEGMELQYASTDGDLKNINNETIVMSSNRKGVLIRKKDLVNFLENNNLDILWTLTGEKLSFNNHQKEESYFTYPCGVYYLKDSKLEGELKMYDRK